MEHIDEVVWKPASDLAAQEQALDALLPFDKSDGPCYVTQNVGSQSTAHRQALLFGAAEYERLAALASSPDEQSRLSQKANQLRERAAE